MMDRRCRESGMALLTVMFVMALLASLFGAYVVLTQTELALVKSSKDTQSGFNAAEAGLNLRAEQIRNIFIEYDRPSGVAPADGIESCDAGANGSGDYLCRTYNLENRHSAVTYVTEEAGNPVQRVIPTGEKFAGLSSQEYRYTVTAVGRNSQQSNEAILDLTFMSRMIPLFQFAIFFQEDLEFFNGATLTVDGPVHSNSDIYLGPQDGGTSRFAGTVTTAGHLYRGQKSQSTCTGYTGTASVSNTSDTTSPSYVNLPSCSSSRVEVTNVTSWNHQIDLDMEPVTVPVPEDMDPFGSGEYWQNADLRLALALDGSGNPDTTYSTTGVRVYNADNTVDASATTSLHHSTCTGAISQGGSTFSVGTRGPSDSSKLRLYREYAYNATTSNYQRTFEVDMQALLNCLQQFPSIMGGRLLSDTTQEGLVFHLTIDGPQSASSHNNYSIRIRNGATLQSNISGAAVVKGLTVVSNQGIVVWGNYNSSTTSWVPAALMGDTMWLLSNSWTDADSDITDAYTRDGSATTVRAAVVSGIRRTGGANGAAGRDQGHYTNGGGVINVFRFNEWFRTGSSGIPDFTYDGSIVSLGAPRHSASNWGNLTSSPYFNYYSAPNRDWDFETRFNDADTLPPMTPVFVYLKQELFVRDYTIDD